MNRPCINRAGGPLWTVCKIQQSYENPMRFTHTLGIINSDSGKAVEVPLYYGQITILWYK